MNHVMHFRIALHLMWIFIGVWVTDEFFKFQNFGKFSIIVPEGGGLIHLQLNIKRGNDSGLEEIQDSEWSSLCCRRDGVNGTWDKTKPSFLPRLWSFSDCGTVLRMI